MAFVKGLLYHILLFSRGLFKIGFKIIGGLFTLILIAGFFQDPKKWLMIIVGGLFSFLFYLLSYYYDVLIIKLTPEKEGIALHDSNRTLY